MIGLFLRILFLPLRIPIWIYARIRNLFPAGDTVFHIMPDRFTVLRPVGLLSRFIPRSETHYVEYLALLEVFRKSALSRIIVQIPHMEASWPEIEEITRRWERIADAGKELIFCSEGGDLKSLYIMSAGKERYVSPHASFLIVFPSVEPVYLKDVLARLGVKVETYAAGKYKSAGEMFSRSSISKPARDNLEELLLDLRSVILRGLDGTRGMETDRRSAMTAFLRNSVIVTAEDLVRLGFALHKSPEDFQNVVVPVPHAYARRNAERGSTPPVELTEYAMTTEDAVFRRYARSRFPFLRIRSAPAVAYVAMEGPILMGRPGDAPSMIGVSALSHRDIFKGLEESREEAVFLHINSPGGSADASEILYQAIERLGRKKPVIALLGETAASGGYYAAAAAHRIYAAASTITGSIGVIMMRPNFKSLYKRTGVKKERIAFDRTRDLFSDSDDLSRPARALVEKHLKESYSTFLNRVASGRHAEIRQVERVGEGKIWAGIRFAGLGMMDGVMDFVDALEEYKAVAGYKERQEFDVFFYPAVKADLRSVVGPRLPIPGLARIEKIAQWSRLFTERRIGIFAFDAVASSIRS